jgi:hypothetical protein
LGGDRLLATCSDGFGVFGSAELSQVLDDGALSIEYLGGSPAALPLGGEHKDGGRCALVAYK